MLWKGTWLLKLNLLWHFKKRYRASLSVTNSAPSRRSFYNNQEVGIGDEGVSFREGTLVKRGETSRNNRRKGLAGDNTRRQLDKHTDLVPRFGEQKSIEQSIVCLSPKADINY